MAMNEDELELHERLSKLKTIFTTPSGGNVVLVGDVMLDRYIHGYANDLNSRAPVPVLKETSRYDDVGAAAHVARGLESLGLATSLFSIVGDDDAGEIIIDSLEEENVDCTGILLVENKVTTVKNRLIASRPSLITSEQLLLRWDIEDEGNIPDSALQALIDSAVEKMDESDVLVISDYGHGVLTDWGTETLIKAAKKANIPTICDPKLTGLHRIKGVDWVLFQTRGLDLLRRRMGAADASECAARLLEENQWSNLLVLGGEAGVTVYSANEEEIHVRCTLGQPLQVIGLLDAAAVAVTSALCLKLSSSDVAYLVNAACEVIMSTEGRFTLTRSDLSNRLDEVSWNMQISKR
jgi:D-beta-D-heptose 7-phosphate kinase/D-beta-D-heptose 1-phosphate adenosyltransferase